MVSSLCTSITTKERLSLVEDGKSLLPRFHPALVEIQRGRRIVVFDSALQYYKDSSNSVSNKDNLPDNSNDEKLPVIFLHGFPDNATGARLVASEILESSSGKRRCLLFSCPGYDLTSISPSKGRSTIDAVAEDYLVAINHVLGEKSRFHVVGHDWGAAHASCLARKQAPDRIASLTMASVPHNMAAGMKAFPKEQFRKSWYMAFFQLPLLPEWWIFFAGKSNRKNDGLRWLWRSWSPAYDFDSAYFESVRRTLSQPGVIRSAINMYRENLGISFLIQYLAVQTIVGLHWLIGCLRGCKLAPLKFSNEGREEHDSTFSMPVLAITGENDGCIDTRLFDVTMSSTHTTKKESLEEENGGDNADRDLYKKVYRRGCSLLRIPNAGHFVFSENPQSVAESIIKIMDKSDLDTKVS